MLFSTGCPDSDSSGRSDSSSNDTNPTTDTGLEENSGSVDSGSDATNDNGDDDPGCDPAMAGQPGQWLAFSSQSLVRSASPESPAHQYGSEETGVWIARGDGSKRELIFPWRPGIRIICALYLAAPQPGRSTRDRRSVGKLATKSRGSAMGRVRRVLTLARVGIDTHVGVRRL